MADVQKLKKVEAEVTVQSWHGDLPEGEPGYSIRTSVTYLDVPETIVPQLSRVMAGTIEAMAAFGDAAIVEKTKGR